MTLDLGTLGDDARQELVKLIKNRLGETLSKTTWELWGSSIRVYLSAFVFWFFIVNWIRSIGLPSFKVDQTLFLFGILLLTLVTHLLGKLLINRTKLLTIFSLALMLPGYYIQGSFFQRLYEIYQIIPLASLVSISVIACPYTASRAVTERLGNSRVSGFRRIVTDYTNGLSLMITAFPSILGGAIFLLILVFSSALGRSVVAVKKYPSVMSPGVAEALLQKSCKQFVLEDQAFGGYHYSFESLSPPYIVRAFGNYTTVVRMRGSLLPIEEYLTPHVPARNAPIDAELSITFLLADGQLTSKVSDVWTFHYLSTRKIMRKGAMWGFPSDLKVKFSDYFGELHPKRIITFGKRNLYDIAFRHPARKDDPYVMKVEHDATPLRIQERTYRFDLDVLADQDLENVKVRLLSKDRPFKKITPQPVSFAGTRAELVFNSLPRNTRVTILIEFVE